MSKLKYGNPTPKQLNKMNRDTPMVDINEDQLPWKNPPSHNSLETVEELKRVREATVSLTPEMREAYRFLDKSVSKPFKLYCKYHNLDFDKEYFKNLLDNLETHVLRLKYAYNRPRPFQVAMQIGMPFSREELETTSTPSYPSGHSLQSRVIANILSDIYPSHSEDFLRMSEMIGLSRMGLGVHFPSDISFGERLGDYISNSVTPPQKVAGIPGGLNIREAFRDFLVESETGSVKLRVIDFDDTIAHTTERVRIETPVTPENPKGYKMISSDEFAVYSLGEGEYFDKDKAFIEFDKVDVDSAQPVPFVSDLFKTFVEAQGNREILILTARDDKVRDHVMSFLSKRLGIENPESKVMFKGVANKDPMAKVAVILGHLKNNPEINFVSFFDDSGKNVKAVKAFIDVINSVYRERGEDRKISGDIRQVVKDEDTEEVSLKQPEYTPGERVDFRKMVSDYLKGEDLDY
mgnify:CR=1 FL=1